MCCPPSLEHKVTRLLNDPLTPIRMAGVVLREAVTILSRILKAVVKLHHKRFPSCIAKNIYILVRLGDIPGHQSI